jgi:hypothetical protein
MCVKPRDFGVAHPNLFLVGKCGLLSLTDQYRAINGCSVTKLFQVSKDVLGQVIVLSSDLFLVTTENTEAGQQLYLINLALSSVRPLLKRSLETLSTSPMSITKSSSGEFFVVVIACAVILVFQIRNGDAVLLKTAMSEEQENLIPCFSGESTFSLIHGDFQAEKFEIDPTRSPPIHRSRISYLAFPDKLGLPLVCQAVSNKILIGTDSGNLVLCDWGGEAPIVIELKARAIVEIYVAPACRSAIVTDSTGDLFDVDLALPTITSHQFQQEVGIVKFFSAHLVLDCSGVHFGFRTSRFFEPVEIPIDPFFGEFPLFQTLERRIELFKSGVSARECQFTLLADLFDCLDDSVLIPSCFGANLNKERMRKYLNAVDLFMCKDNEEMTKAKRMRLMILRGDFRAAADLLMSTPTTSPSFSIDVLKAGIIDSPGFGSVAATCVAALIDGGKIGDAVDLLMITRRFNEAGRALLSEGNVELAIQMMRAVMDEIDDWTMLEQAVKLLLTQNHWKAAVEVLIAFHLFDRAGELLTNEGFAFPGEVIGSLPKYLDLASHSKLLF